MSGVQALRATIQAFLVVKRNLEAPPILAADVPVVIDNFSIRPANNTPFLYAFLSSSAATAMVDEERRVAIGMAGLQTDLTNFEADNMFEALEAPLKSSGLSRMRSHAGRGLEGSGG